jgi:hypothetical protein
MIGASDTSFFLVSHRCVAPSLLFQEAFSLFSIAVHPDRSFFEKLFALIRDCFFNEPLRFEGTIL